MLTVKGVYDGQKVEILEEIPFRGTINVLVTFLNDTFNEPDTLEDVDPIEALRGCSKKSNLTEKLLKYRQEDRAIEEAKRRL